MDVLEIVKAKVPSDQLPSDTLLNMHVAEVRQAILTFCNRTDIPAELVFVHANMVVDLITSENRRTNPDGQTEVTSIKEGDTEVRYGNSKVSASESSTEQVLNNYKAQLLRFRKLRW